MFDVDAGGFGAAVVGVVVGVGVYDEGDAGVVLADPLVAV